MRIPRPQRSARLATGILAATLAAGACTSDDPVATPTTDLKGDDVVLTSGALTTLGSCDALLERLIAEGLERVGPYGFTGNSPYGGGSMVDFAEETLALDEASAAPTARQSEDDGGEALTDSATASSGSSDSDFSGTNNQEGGVDEADFVKTDGKRLVVVTGNQVQILDVTGSAPVLLHTVKLDDNVWAQEMFLAGDRAIILSNTWEEASQVTTREAGASSLLVEGRSVSRFIEIDLDSGTVGSDFTIEGNYLSGREVDGSIRIVLNSRVGQFPFVYASNEASEATAEKANRDVVENSTISDWLPNYRATNGSIDQLFDCDKMYIPEDFAGFGVLSVITLDLNDGLDLGDSLGVLSEGQTIYSSPTRLAVTTTRWDGDFGWSEDGIAEGANDEYTTAVHTFDISDPSATNYVASGTIPGHLLNQYSMSEHEGHLRIAVTEGSPWGGIESQSGVVVLKENGASLDTVGSVSGLGKGEQIQSVRFMGDVGFIVTFRQTDPLYTVDLSDPTDPTVLGELKIPGFSAYLHPSGDGQLIGVGQDGNEEGRLLGAQVSVFDVSDLTNPTRVTSLAFGENSHTQVGWDAKSFTWWAPTRTAFVPVSSWNWNEETNTDSNSAEVVALTIAEDGTITELGRISHDKNEYCEDGYYAEEEPVAIDSLDSDEPASASPESGSDDAEADLARPVEPAEWCYSYQPDIRRSIVIGETVFTVSDTGVQANALDGLATTGWAEFDRS